MTAPEDNEGDPDSKTPRLPSLKLGPKVPGKPQRSTERAPGWGAGCAREAVDQGWRGMLL
jgi:hypothetical protein